MRLEEGKPQMSVISNFSELREELMLADEHLTLRESYARFLEKNELDATVRIPLIVRLLENPRSPFRLTGAVSLYHHDIIHCILGRGVKGYDEAFVIGMTMGSVKSLRNYEVKLYKFVSRHLFPGIYNFSHDDLLYFDAGIALSRSMPAIKPLDVFNPAEMLDKPLQYIRAELGIEMDKVMQVIFPDSEPVQESEMVVS